MDFMKKWKMNQDDEDESTSEDESISEDESTSEDVANEEDTTKFSIGQIVLLNGTKLSFAKIHPIAEIKSTNEDGSKIEVILLQKNNDDAIQPFSNLTHIVNVSDVCRVLSNHNDQKSAQLAYFKLKCKNQKLKQNTRDIARIQSVMNDYLGQKFKTALNNTNFNKHRNFQKDTEVEQEVNKKDVELYKQYLEKRQFKFTDNSSYLKITIQTPAQLGSIIGSGNVMRIHKGYEYFAKYPLLLRYGYKLKYPKFKIIKINVLRKNLAGNMEK